MRKFMLMGLISIIIVITTACGSSNKPSAADFNMKVEPFEYTDQDGSPFSLSDLENKVWIADVVFTYCTTVCPAMTANMAELQKRISEAGIEAELVSFSVDPERDDPAALKGYLGKFDANFTNWHALTGYKFDEIKSFILKSFKTIVVKDTASDQVIHGTSFFLIDQSGSVVGKYDGTMDTPFDQIIKDIKALQA